MVSVNKINNSATFTSHWEDGSEYCSNTRRQGSGFTYNQERYIDRKFQEQEDKFEKIVEKSIEKQNKIIGSSLVAMVNYLNGNSDANSTRELIQNKLIKKQNKKGLNYNERI